jgi:hypothetical protein
MTKFAILPGENVVVADGRKYSVDCSSIDPAIRAVQWDAQSSRGHLEFFDLADGRKRPNVGVDDPSQFAEAISEWRAIDNAPSAPAPPPTPAEQRMAEFRELPDQIDLMDRLESATPEGIGAWVDAQVVDLAGARRLLALILVAMAADSRG